jgi:CBS domain-containing protein
MDTVGKILKEKGSDVFSVTPQATVLEAVEAMSAKQVGAVLVCQDGEPVGIFSERDLMTRVILDRRDPKSTRVEDVMSRDIACVEPRTDAAEAMAIMTERRCRHLPVVEGGKITGVVSIGDLVRWESRNHRFEIRMLHDYITGKYPG